MIVAIKKLRCCTPTSEQKEMIKQKTDTNQKISIKQTKPDLANKV